MSRILITGGAGFIGYFLAKRLSENKNNNITIFDNLSRGKMDEDLQALLSKNNVEFMQGDLVDAKYLLRLTRDYDYIYHLAAIIGVRNIMQNPDRVLRINAISTLNIFDYAKDLKKLKKIFYSSTSEVYSGTISHFSFNIPTAEDVPLTIEDIFADRTTYALSKIYGESIALIYGRKYGIPVAIGRYHNVYGPRMGCDHVIPETFLKIHRNNIVDVASPMHTRAFCYIDDAVEFTIRICESEAVGNGIVHIGNGREEISIKDLVGKIAHNIGKEIKINELSDTPGSPKRRCPDTSKAERLTGYRAVISLDEGIRRAYSWYKDRLDNISQTCNKLYQR